MSMQNCRGSSLIEVLISIMLMIIPIVAFSSLEIAIMNGNSLERESTRVLALTQQTLEGLKTTPYPNLVSGSKQQDGYTIHWTVNDNSPQNNLKTLTVRANWLQNGRNRSVNLKTIIAK